MKFGRHNTSRIVTIYQTVVRSKGEDSDMCVL